jgi:hypothetical protein
LTRSLPSCRTDHARKVLVHTEIAWKHDLFDFCRACSVGWWLMADGWCWFVLRKKYCWLVTGSWFVVREKYWWLSQARRGEEGRGSGEHIPCRLPWYLLPSREGDSQSSPGSSREATPLPLVTATSRDLRGGQAADASTSPRGGRGTQPHALPFPLAHHRQMLPRASC